MRLGKVNTLVNLHKRQEGREQKAELESLLVIPLLNKYQKATTMYYIWTDAEAETPVLSHLMGSVDSLEKTLVLGGIGGRRRRGRPRMRW